MSDITLYHNPNCSKSRKTLELLETQGYEPNIVLYLETPPSVEELKDIVGMLNIEPARLVREGEAEYSPEMEHYSNEQIFDAITNAPILMQRPIVTANGQARIGRPPESVLEIL